MLDVEVEWWWSEVVTWLVKKTFDQLVKKLEKHTKNTHLGPKGYRTSFGPICIVELGVECWMLGSSDEWWW